MRPALLLLPLLLFATAAPAAADVKAACMADFLATLRPPGGGRVVACMKAHRAQISTVCKVAVLRHIVEKRGLISAEETP